MAAKVRSSLGKVLGVSALGTASKDSKSYGFL